MAESLIEWNRDQPMRIKTSGLSITFPNRVASLSLRAVRSFSRNHSQVHPIAGPAFNILLSTLLIFYSIVI